MQGYTQTGANNLLVELLAAIDSHGKTLAPLAGIASDENGYIGKDKTGKDRPDKGRTTSFADVSTPDSDGVYFLISTECMRGIWHDLYLDGNGIKGLLEIEQTKAAELGLVLGEYTRPVEGLI